MSFLELFNLTHWQDVFAMIFFIIVLMILGLLMFKKSKIKLIAFSSLVLAVVGIITFSLLKIFTVSGWEEDAKIWLGIPLQIIFSMIIFFSPILLFSTLGLTISKIEKKNFSRKGFYFLISLLIGIIGAIGYQFILKADDFTFPKTFTSTNWKWLNVTLLIAFGSGVIIGFFILYAKATNVWANKLKTFLKGANTLANVSFYFIDKVIWLLIPLFCSYQIIGAKSELENNFSLLIVLMIMTIPLVGILIKIMISVKNKRLPIQKFKAWSDESKLVYDVEQLSEHRLKVNYFLILLPTFLFGLILMQKNDPWEIAFVSVMFLAAIIIYFWGQKHNSFISNQILVMSIFFISGNFDWEVFILLWIFTKLLNPMIYLSNLKIASKMKEEV